MTTKTQPTASTTKPHTDGGTYRVLQLAETRDRWAIAITEWTTYRGQVKFEVLRVSPANATVRLGILSTEQEARSFANREWKLDRKI